MATVAVVAVAGGNSQLKLIETSWLVEWWPAFDSAMETQSQPNNDDDDINKDAGKWRRRVEREEEGEEEEEELR